MIIMIIMIIINYFVVIVVVPYIRRTMRHAKNTMMAPT